MNLELFLARRLYSSHQPTKRISSPAIRVAMIGVSIGIIAMILSVSIVVGFKNQVREKVIGFGSHIQVTSYDNKATFETNPIAFSDSVLNALKKTDGVTHTQLFITKPGIIKTDEDFQGIVLKGVGKDFDWTFIKQNLVEGRIPDPGNGNEILISRYIANRLNLKLGDGFLTYFIKDAVSARKFKIVGIYETNFDEYDKLFVITSLNTLQRLNGWDRDQYSGLELTIRNFDELDYVKQNIFFKMSIIYDRQGHSYFTKSIRDMNPGIFSWLELLDLNTTIIILLMLIVSGVTMISGLLIIILEHTNLIGILKAMGVRNGKIRKTFLYFASFIILKGMFWGNLIGLGLCFLQKQYGFVKLDPSTYYLSQVPIELNAWYILVINIGTLIISMAMIVGPSYMIARISPAKSIKFE
ncbi:MAG: ABC transporter permease [Bacteroidales bacterium 45-6]|nr:MAG: ABC transporter permease [Bacteroidales bacterium 45-6]